LLQIWADATDTKNQISFQSCAGRQVLWNFSCKSACLVLANSYIIFFYKICNSWVQKILSGLFRMKHSLAPKSCSENTYRILVVFVVLYVYLFYCVCIAVFTLDAGLLARSQYPEGPATGHLDTGFSWFPCVYKQMLRSFQTFQFATTCF